MSKKQMSASWCNLKNTKQRNMSIRIHMTAKHMDNINRIPVYSGFGLDRFHCIYFSCIIYGRCIFLVKYFEEIYLKLTSVFVSLFGSMVMPTVLDSPLNMANLSLPVSILHIIDWPTINGYPVYKGHYYYNYLSCI